MAKDRKRRAVAATKKASKLKIFARKHGEDPEDQRLPAEKDRDRLLYSSSLRRLAGVTQVASATEVDIFHNRLTHTLKVAQVGRRVAEKLVREADKAGVPLVNVNPDVVESAALAHDLGHPPFGHIAEVTLDECLRAKGAHDGYEGNAQSFRIITQLAFCREEFPGMNLTRETLNASLKYPWFRSAEGPHSKKFGAYQSEHDDFEFARNTMPGSEEKSIEAQIMDIADDITYSVHDMEDFFQAGLIPLDRLAVDRDERDRLYQNTQARWSKRNVQNFNDYVEAFEQFATTLPNLGPYTGAANQRKAIKPIISTLVHNYVHAIQTAHDRKGRLESVSIRHDRRLEIDMLKELTWNYVINSPSLASQQHGQKKIIRSLFDTYVEAISSGDTKIIPAWFRQPKPLPKAKSAICRMAADVISSFTDRQAHIHYMRLNGMNPGSIRDFV